MQLKWLALALALSVTSPCSAQNATFWTEPAGRFTLSFPGWTAVPSDVAARAGDMLIITRNDTLNDHRPRICAVSQRPPHDLDGGQTAANAQFDQVTAADVEHNVGQPVSDFSRTRVGGVATLDYFVLLNGTQQHTRAFVLATNKQMIVFDITCATPPPTTDDEAASIEAVLNSVVILQPPSASTSTDPAAWLFRGEPACRAVRFGSQVDTQLMRNRDGHLVLIAGHPGWEHNGGPLPGSLTIDGGQPIVVSGMGVGPLFMVLLTDAQLASLRAARVIQWHLPWGEFTADVSGLGSAFDAISVCPE